MEEKGECKKGEFKAHAKSILGRDIREVYQDVYGLINVFRAILHGEMTGLAEADFDKMDSSKLALLSTFTGEKHGHLLPQAIEAAKNGTAADMRKLKPKEPKKEPEAKEPAKPETTSIPVGFAATDIGPADPLVLSGQVRNRPKAEFDRAEDGDADDALVEMMKVFSQGFMRACESLGINPHARIDELAALRAKQATGSHVTPVAGVIEVSAVAA